ncbi:kinase-like domain-containing protein [Aspergillus transmontanensis]|uniref:non-specific serine/threonine protein kinase n=1 Tax=Aspergillus transmontanensis TaxID=1034304 RepID=A0A5N6VTZ8_9EURO|nr:kinase-like domain-containing protein [Aspergillus transmontanensis]
MSKSFFSLTMPLHSRASFSPCPLIFMAISPYLARRTSRAFSNFKLMSPTKETGRVLYRPIQYVERMEYYEPGGYHPVKIGDCFHNRYRVMYKLGHGTYSTIWLARDEIPNTNVAVKVCRANSSPREIDILEKLSNPKPSSDTGRAIIPSILDKFNIQGPNGTHICLVTRPARMSVSDAKTESWIGLFQLKVARAIAAQLVIAVQYIHSQRLVHGDLHRGNILFLPSRGFTELATETIYKEYGEPEFESVNRLDGQKLPPTGVPEYGVIPIWLGEASENISLPEARILLSDFDEAFSPAQEKKFESHTPLLIRPPEARFEPTKSLTFSSDIWSLACTIWDLVAQKTLFEWIMTDEDDMTCQQIGLLGPLPIEWQEKHGESIHQSKYQNRSLEGHFEKTVQQARIEARMPSLESDEQDALLSMLRSMLCFQPEHRPSARQVLESEWMVNWALPEYEKQIIGYLPERPMV